MLIPFFLLTFLFSWSVWFATAGLAAPGNTGFFGIRGPIFLLGVFAPAIVAVALTAHAEGRAGVAKLLERIGRWQVNARWYAFAIAYFAVIKIAAAVVHRVVTAEWPRFGETSVGIILVGIALSTLVQAGEEVGWRGYALPRLAEHLGLGGASVVLGAIWAAWHLPLFFLPESGSTGQSFPAYLLHVMGMSVVFSWMYWKTQGSLLLVMLMHAAVNNTTGIVPGAVGGTVAPFALGASLVTWATVALQLLLAAPLLVRMRNADIRAMASTPTVLPRGFST